MKNKFNINNIPAVLYGKPSKNVYLFIHGKCGYKEEAERFSKTACAKGWQVLAIDLPEHGERKSEKDTFNPWNIVPELKIVLDYVKERWGCRTLYSISIGAYFSLLAFKDEYFQNALFISPVLDMKLLIENMMQWSNVTKDDLRNKQEIKTYFGETLSWKYYTYVKQNPVNNWNAPTHILYAENDNLTSIEIVDKFKEEFNCSLTVMQNGEHWFHTDEQLMFLEKWEQKYT